MSKGRLEAFSDGVIAILITIMVLELRVPHGADWEALRDLAPTFWSYVLSFIFLGIYWNNHHHLWQVAHHVKIDRSFGQTFTCCSGSPWCRSSLAGWGRMIFRDCRSRCMDCPIDVWAGIYS